MIEQSLIRRSYHAPVASNELYVPTFDGALLQRVTGIIQQPEIEKSMRECNPHIPADEIVKGEVGRLVMLSGAFHPDFYHKSIGALMACGAIRPGYSMIELGTSFCAHLPQMPKKLQPGFMKGLDNIPFIVAAAKASVLAFENAGLLNSEGIEIYPGDHNYLNGVKGDISVLSLASQYDGGPAGTVEWLMSHCGVAGINGDVIHSPIEITEENITSGILPLKSSRLLYFDGYTGVNLKLEGEAKETIFGDVYRTTLLLDDEIYNASNGIVQIPQPGAELEGKATVFKRDGKYFVEPWAWELTDQATEDDKRYLPAIRRTFNEQYSLLEFATDPVRKWESVAGLGVPVYAAEKYGLYNTVAFNTATKVAERSGMLPMAMLRRNGEEVRKIHEKGLFSQIGEGKTFADLDDLYRVVGSYLSNAPRFFNIVKYTNPLLVTSTTTSSKEVFEALQKVR
ncbi:MAG: hypothetical protein WCV81_03895 [Microgenomates group bacterium]